MNITASITFSIALVFISWIIGMIITTFIKNTNYYKNELSNLNFLKNEKLNTIIGVDVIKWIVKNTFFKFFNQKLKINGKIDTSNLKDLRAEMTKSEIDHLIAFLCVMIVIVHKIWLNQYSFALILLIINTITNLYPSLLQQQNKRRIDKLLIK